MRPALRAVLVLLAFATTSARAQAPLPERLYVGSGILLGSNRTVALAGATAGLGEGIDGVATNLAALAQRDPRREGNFDFDFGLSYLNAPATPTLDLDNDGKTDAADRTDQVQGGLMLQVGKAGLGLVAHSTAVTYKAPDRFSLSGVSLVKVTRSQASVGLGLAFDRDQILFGLGLTGATAVFASGGQTWTFSGANLEAGLLFRPLGKRFRFAMVGRGGTVGVLEGGGHTDPTPLGRPLFAGTVSPAVFSVGTAVRFGPGSERFNRLSKAAIAEVHKRRGAADPVFDGDFDHPPGPWLLVAQVDVVGAAPHATSLSAFTQEAPPELIGRTMLVVPRAGVEWEALEKRLRARAGSYLEPSPFAGAWPRPHLTVGFEWLAFHLWDDWTLSGALDVSPRYQQVGLGIGFWR